MRRSTWLLNQGRGPGATIKKIEDAHPQAKEEGRVVALKLDLTEPAGVIGSAKMFMGIEQNFDILREKEALC